MTDDVYNYMLDDIQKEVLRARNKMEDIVKHLENHATPARFKAQEARDILENMRKVTKDIDELPYFEERKK